MVKHMKPVGARGRAAVKRLGRNYKTGAFDRIAAAAGGGAKGAKIAGAIYWKKVHARG